MALCLKRRPAWTSLDGGGGGCCCSKWTTFISILTLTIGLLFLGVTICSLTENRKSPFETSGAPHSTQEIRLREIDQQSSAFISSAVEMSSEGSNRRSAQRVRPLNERSPRMISEEAESRRNRETPVRLTVDRKSSVKHVKRRLRDVVVSLLLQTDPLSTHTKGKQSMNNRIRRIRLLNGLKQRSKTISLRQRRKLRLENLSERRKTLLPLDKRTDLGQPSLSKSTQINRPTNKPSTGRPCCVHSHPLCQATTLMQTKRRDHRRKRSANEEVVRKLKTFFIRLLEAAMTPEERTARNLTDSFLDALLKEETESNNPVDDKSINQSGINPAGEKNINQTGINPAGEKNIKQSGINPAGANNINQSGINPAGEKNINQSGINPAGANNINQSGINPADENNINQIGINPFGEKNINQTGINKTAEEQKHEILLGNSTGGKENITGKSAVGEIGGTNETRGKEGKKMSAEVAESVQGPTGGGFGNFSPGEIGGPGHGKLIISAQIVNGSESKELGQIVVDSKNLMEVAIKVMNGSFNGSAEQKEWVVELNGEQKMFVAAVIAIASIVAVGTLVFACVWCLYDHEGLCMGVFPCLKPPKDNFSPQRWWMETLARRVENLESQPFLATEKYKRTSISPKYQTTKEEGRLSQMVTRLSERMSKGGGHNMTKKEQMARNSQMARASQTARDSQTESDMARDVKAVRESMQERDNQQNKSSNQHR